MNILEVCAPGAGCKIHSFNYVVTKATSLCFVLEDTDPEGEQVLKCTRLVRRKDTSQNEYEVSNVEDRA